MLLSRLDRTKRITSKTYFKALCHESSSIIVFCKLTQKESLVEEEDTKEETNESYKERLCFYGTTVSHEDIRDS